MQPKKQSNRIKSNQARDYILYHLDNSPPTYINAGYSGIGSISMGNVTGTRKMQSMPHLLKKIQQIQKMKGFTKVKHNKKGQNSILFNKDDKIHGQSDYFIVNKYMQKKRMMVTSSSFTKSRLFDMRTIHENESIFDHKHHIEQNFRQKEKLINFFQRTMSNKNSFQLSMQLNIIQKPNLRDKNQEYGGQNVR